jgi:RNA polymerase sigma-70 factor (ECF subfamily)
LKEVNASGGTRTESVLIQDPEQEGRDVALAKGGDQQAFERLYRHHHGRVYSLALRMTGGDWAEDLTQEVFIRAWQKLRTFRGEAAFGTWLHRLAVNLLLSRRETLRRRMQKQLPGGDALERFAARGANPGLALDLDAAIQRLPEGARRVFVLYDVEGYPHAEIAEMMGIDPGTSKSQLHRARMMLREHLR